MTEFVVEKPPETSGSFIVEKPPEAVSGFIVEKPPETSFLQRVNEFLQPTAEWAGRVHERLAESGQAVLDLPSTAYRAATGQVGAMDLVRTGLKAIGAPFEPIFAPVGEAVRTAAEPLLGEKGAATAGAVGEMALGVALPFVRVPATPATRGLTKVGIGRLPEEAVAAERAAAGVNLPAAGRELEQAAAAEATAARAAEEAAKPGPRTTMAAARTFRETQAGAQALAGRIAKIEEAGLPVPKTMRREYEVLKATMAKPVPEVSPILVEEQAASISHGIKASQPLAEAAGKADAIPVVRIPGKAPKPMLTEEAAARIEADIGRRIPDSLRGTRLSVEAERGIEQAVEATMTKHSIPRDPNMPISLQGFQVMLDHPEEFSAFQGLLEKNGTTLVDFGQMMLSTNSDAGRILGLWGNGAKRLAQIAAQNPEAKALLAEMEKSLPPLTSWERATHFAGRFWGLWKGSIVSAWSTWERNAVTQVANIGLMQVEKGVDGMIRRLFAVGPEAERGIMPAVRSTLELFSTLASKGKRQDAVDLLKLFPDEYEAVFSHYASEVAARAERLRTGAGPLARAADQAFAKAESVVNAVNIPNRAQEFFFRKTVFRVSMADQLAAKGADIDRILPGQVTGEMVARAASDSLERTWALTPKEGFWKAFTDLYKNPIAGVILNPSLPFGRFLYNSLRYTYQYSPANARAWSGAMRLLTGTERAAILNGDVQAMSRAVMGSAMFGAAWQFRNSKYAGDRSYEAKIAGKPVDLRPFNPFVSYSVVAELAKRSMNGTMLKADAESMARDVLAIVASGNFRQGAGITAVDDIMVSLIEGGTNLETATRTVRKVSGEIAGGFLQPMTTVRELYASYGQFLTEHAKEEAKIRETRESPFLGPAMRRIPGVSQMLPEREVPLTSTTPELESFTPGGIPLSRQIIGVSPQTRSPLETEVLRLGLTRQEIQGRGTGDPTADRLILREMGPLAERILGAFTTSTKYQGMTDPERRVAMVAALSVIRQGAEAQATKEDPLRFRTIRLRQAIPQRQRELLESRGKLPAGVMR